MVGAIDMGAQILHKMNLRLNELRKEIPDMIKVPAKDANETALDVYERERDAGAQLMGHIENIIQFDHTLAERDPGYRKNITRSMTILRRDSSEDFNEPFSTIGLSVAQKCKNPEIARGFDILTRTIQGMETSQAPQKTLKNKPMSRRTAAALAAGGTAVIAAGVASGLYLHELSQNSAGAYDLNRDQAMQSRGEEMLDERQLIVYDALKRGMDMVARNPRNEAAFRGNLQNIIKMQRAKEFSTPVGRAIVSCLATRNTKALDIILEEIPFAGKIKYITASSRGDDMVKSLVKLAEDGWVNDRMNEALIKGDRDYAKTIQEKLSSLGKRQEIGAR